MGPGARARRGRRGWPPGPDGLPRFDLEAWDERFFRRLRTFLAAAAARGVVVELVFFGSPHGDELCRLFPLHPASNVNGVGTGMARWQDVMTLADPSVTEHQRRLVRKLVTETNAFDNLYYEICNEPVAVDAAGRPAPERLRDWQQAMIETVRETERTLPRRHLVAVNCQMSLPARDPEGPLGLPVGVLDDGYYRHNAEVDLLNFHYISHRLPREGLHHQYPGGARPKAPAYRFGHIAPFVALRAPAGKAIGFDEDFAGIVHGQPPRPAQKRMEAWESLLGGCATYDHLDFTFTTDDPTGAGAGTPPAGIPRDWLDGRELRRRFGAVAALAADLDLITLRPDLLGGPAGPVERGDRGRARRPLGARGPDRLPGRPAAGRGGVRRDRAGRAVGAGRRAPRCPLRPACARPEDGRLVGPPAARGRPLGRPPARPPALPRGPPGRGHCVARPGRRRAAQVGPPVSAAGFPSPAAAGSR